jgi:hypothetical protein
MKKMKFTDLLNLRVDENFRTDLNTLSQSTGKNGSKVIRDLVYEAARKAKIEKSDQQRMTA